MANNRSNSRQTLEEYIQENSKNTIQPMAKINPTLSTPANVQPTKNADLSKVAPVDSWSEPVSPTLIGRDKSVNQRLNFLDPIKNTVESSALYQDLISNAKVSTDSEPDNVFKNSPDGINPKITWLKDNKASEVIPASEIPAGVQIQMPEYKESANVTAARQLLEKKLSEMPAYKSRWQGQIDSLVGKIQNRPGFSYDATKDNLYQMYRDRYIQNAKLAMEDTMGQAAALTGGYGNSYAATVGNQAYQQSMNGLNDVIPELYQLAYNKYAADTNNMYNQLNMLMGQEESDYGKYKDQVNIWNNEVDRAQSDYNKAIAEDKNDYNIKLQTILPGNTQGADEKTSQNASYTITNNDEKTFFGYVDGKNYASAEKYLNLLLEKGADPNVVMKLVEFLPENATDAEPEKTVAYALTTNDKDIFFNYIDTKSWEKAVNYLNYLKKQGADEGVLQSLLSYITKDKYKNMYNAD